MLFCRGWWRGTARKEDAAMGDRTTGKGASESRLGAIDVWLYRAIMENMEVMVFERPSMDATRMYVHTEYRVGLGTVYYQSNRSGGAVVELARVARYISMLGLHGDAEITERDIRLIGRDVAELAGIIDDTGQYPCDIERARRQAAEWDWECGYDWSGSWLD